jgi:hypothetical protein
MQRPSNCWDDPTSAFFCGAPPTESACLTREQTAYRLRPVLIRTQFAFLRVSSINDFGNRNEVGSISNYDCLMCVEPHNAMAPKVVARKTRL